MKRCISEVFFGLVVLWQFEHRISKKFLRNLFLARVAWPCDMQPWDAWGKGRRGTWRACEEGGVKMRERVANPLGWYMSMYRLTKTIPPLRYSPKKYQALASFDWFVFLAALFEFCGLACFVFFLLSSCVFLTHLQECWDSSVIQKVCYDTTKTSTWWLWSEATQQSHMSHHRMCFVVTSRVDCSMFATKE